jgi:hypothetical protein
VRTCIQLLQAGTLSEGVVDRYSTAAGVLVRDPDFDRLTRSIVPAYLSPEALGRIGLPTLYIPPMMTPYREVSTMLHYASHGLPHVTKTTSTLFDDILILPLMHSLGRFEYTRTLDLRRHYWGSRSAKYRGCCEGKNCRFQSTGWGMLGK